MSAKRAELDPLPGGVDVFRQKHAVKLGGDLAPLKKGVTGWALMADQILECIVFQRSWRIRKAHPASGVVFKRPVQRTPHRPYAYALC